jgi:BirA family biotin operon repressor/biotin-[acetyl-CoA-carboxylase] ligase
MSRQVPAQLLHAPDLVHALSGLRLGCPVHLYQQIGSTQDEARARARGGAPEGLLVIAEEQTAGRGRAGRRWVTAPGTALAFSLVLRPAIPAARSGELSMLAGLAVCEAIEQAAGLPAMLKWPNDVLIGDKKAGGILAEAATGETLEYALLGIGLNISSAPPPDLVDFPASSLEAEAGRPIDRLPVLRAILERLEAHYTLLAADSARLHTAWSARLAWLGENVVARTPDGEISGRAERTDADGALVVRLDTGAAVRVLAGDVKLRLAPA